MHVCKGAFGMVHGHVRQDNTSENFSIAELGCFVLNIGFPEMAWIPQNLHECRVRKAFPVVFGNVL